MNNVFFYLRSLFLFFVLVYPHGGLLLLIQARFQPRFLRSWQNAHFYYNYPLFDAHIEESVFPRLRLTAYLVHWWSNIYFWGFCWLNKWVDFGSAAARNSCFSCGFMSCFESTLDALQLLAPFQTEIFPPLMNWPRGLKTVSDYKSERYVQGVRNRVVWHPGGNRRD